MTQPTARQRLEALRDDNRGAIMVVGVFFSAFLVGALWYVAGVGNAVLFRERLQDAGDATAFAAAVYHARGMNIIAMINLVMAAVLGVLVALKIAKMLLMITYIITQIICMLPYCVGCWACPIAAAAKTGESAVDSLIEAVEPVINTLLQTMSKLQKAVAITFPIIAEEKALSTAKLYKNPVDGGLMISDSLIPSGSRLGLPVEEDSFTKLCEKAGEFVGEFALAPFAVFGVPTKWASGLVGGLVAMAPSYFCGDSGGGSSGGSGSGSGSGGGQKPSSVDDAAKQICDSQAEAIKKANEELGKKKKLTFDYDKCIEDQKKNMKDVEAASFSSGGGSSNGKTPKKVVEGAKNGGKEFQITAFIWADMKLSNMANKRVRLPAWGAKVAKAPSFWGKVQFSEAEFYYDGSGSWDSLKEDAMWNMRWRARLRRYHEELAPGGQLVHTALSILGLAAPGGLLEGIASFQAGGLDGLTEQYLGLDSKERLSDIYIKNAKKTKGGSGFEKIDRDAKMEVIH